MDVLDKFKRAVSGMEKRSFDKYVLGPFLIWYGLKSKGMGKRSRRVLVGAGIFQIFYSWEKYVRLQKSMVEWFNDQQNKTTEQYRKI